MPGFTKSARQYVQRRINRAVQLNVVKPVATQRQIEQASDLRPRQMEIRGAVEELRSCTEMFEVLVEGPMGTGKTLGILSWLYVLMDTYPGIRILMLRKTRTSMTESVLVSWEDQIVPTAHPMLDGPQRSLRKSYTHINGSELVLGSLHTPQAVKKVLSTEYDIIYIPEAIEIDLKSYEELIGRLRHYVLPWQQMIIDTNPGAPMHWINRRANDGRLHRLVSRHIDNPRYWNETLSEWTDEGARYIDKLNRMTGVRYMRFKLGLWVASEGVVYQEYDARQHLLNSIPGEIQQPGDAKVFPSTWRRIWCVDFGYTNPFVWIQAAIDPDGRIYEEMQIYRTKTLLKDHVADIQRITNQNRTPKPEAIICDHDAQDRAELEHLLGMATIPAYKAVSAGIDAVKSRLVAAGDGKPRLFFLQNSLIHSVDEDLLESGRPTCSIEELGAYSWRVSPDGVEKDEPLKEHDHAMDAIRYIVAYVDKLGESARGPVESLGWVSSSIGWSRVN